MLWILILILDIQDIDHTSKKPEIFEFYNSTKSGVDASYQKCARRQTKPFFTKKK